MNSKALEILFTCFEDPLHPTWSSQVLNDIFEKEEGTMAEKQQKIIPKFTPFFLNILTDLRQQNFIF